MTPHGFGFETCRGDRRSGYDRREAERRLVERRQGIVTIAEERRRGADRRAADRRGLFRRTRRDRRSEVSVLFRGLRITNGIPSKPGRN